VLLPDPALRAEIRRGDEREEIVVQIVIVNTLTIEHRWDHTLRRRYRTRVHRRFGRDRIDRNRRYFVAVPEQTHEAIVRHFSDDGGIEVPLLERAHDLVLAAT